MGSVGTETKETKQQNNWRNENALFQKKTLGGVYFFSSPALWGMDIDPDMYDRLPKRMQRAVIALENSETADGNHATIYYVNSTGEIDYFDEYGLTDFYRGVRHIKDIGDMNNFVYNGRYNLGDQLKRKGE